MACGIFELQDCLTNIFFDILRMIVNAPMYPFLESIKFLLTHPASIQDFASLWAVFVYVLSIFYGIFIIWAGLNFIISGYDPERRERAKQWLQNVLLMVFFVQASYLFYAIIAEIASGLSTGVFNLIDPNFFKITFDVHRNAIIDIVLGLVYLIVLVLTFLLLSVNYLFSSMGVLFFPFGIFFYFIPMLRDLGKFILSLVVMFLFLPFIAAMILLGTAEIVKNPSVVGVKMWLVIAGFLVTDGLMILFALFAIARSVMGIIRSDVVRGALLVKGSVAAAAGAFEKKKEPEQNSREYWGRVHKDYPRYERRE